MSNSPLVSIIVPIYNVEQYLRQCLDSICQQTYQNLEIILVNDGSTDSSGGICEEYASNNSNVVVIHTANKGAGAARNTGVSYAHGKYLYFPDSDDFLDTQAIELLVQTIEEHQADLVFFNALSFWENDFIGQRRQGYFRNHDYPDAPGVEMMSLLQENKEFHASIPLVFFKKSLVIDNDLKIPEGIVLEDMVITFELFLLASKVTYLNKVIYHRRYHSNSVMTTPDWERKYKSALEVYRRVRDFVIASPYRESPGVMQYVANRAHNLLEYYSKMSSEQRLFASPEYDAFLQDLENHHYYQDTSLRMRTKGFFCWLGYKLYRKTIGRLL